MSFVNQAGLTQKNATLLNIIKLYEDIASANSYIHNATFGDIFEIDLNRAAAGADMLIEDKIGHDVPQHIGEVILEMVFQLGTTGVSKFLKFFKALRVKDYKTAAAEMQDSRWHSQTPKRCEHLAEIVANT